LRPLYLDWLRTFQDEPPSGARPGETLDLDAQAVSEVDGAGLQMVLSLANSLKQNHCVLQLFAPSGVMVNACAALGVEHLVRSAVSEADTDGVVA
jgi:ABC-type transporter Mla MlaB component